jgi:tripartite-type tricarboxylate transporter receptor subunit TctC
MRSIQMSMTVAAWLVALAGLPTDGHAQSFPNRPITMVYPFPPQGSPVAFTTIFSEASKILGQPIVVD